MTDAMNQSKEDLRSRMRSVLAAMTDEERHLASVNACARILQLEPFQHTPVVMMYMPLAHEVDITGIAIECFRSAKTVCVPRVNWRRKDMTPIEISSLDDRMMDLDDHGLRTPRGGRLVLPSTINLVVVPGLAFDTHGNRLGRGGGFYDRFLTRLPANATTIGLCFDRQIIDSIPVNERDMAVDMIITERRTTHPHPSCSGNS